MGDRYGNKNGGVQAFLIEAVHEHGARIVQNCRVDRILHTTDTTTTASSSAHSLKGRRRATGVECTLTDTGVQMTIRARHAVIVAAGALRTPGLLTKSGLRNPHIGRHLRLHPVTGVLGFTSPKKDPIDPVLGAPMTTVCNEFVQGPHRDGYGVKIETPCAYPGLLAAASPWLSVQVYKDRLFRYRNCVPLVLVQRDSGDGGRVKMARNGTEVLVDYTMNERDKQSLMMAMQGAAKILVSSQSVEVATGHVYDDGFQTGEKPANEELLNEYLDSILSRGMKDHEIGLFSAHQMGSCRMTASPKTGAVDSNGETWECDDLYVMDASLFPTASGSNPMVTVMTIAHMLSTRLNLLLQLRVQTSSNSTHSTDATHSVSTRRSDIFATDEKCLRRALALSKQREAVRSLHGKSCGGWSTLWSWLKSNSPTMALLPLLIAIPLAWGLGFRPLRTEFLIP